MNNVFETLMYAVINELPRTKTDNDIDEAYKALIKKVKAGEDYYTEENRYFDLLGSRENISLERGVRIGIQLLHEGLVPVKSVSEKH